MSTVGEPPRPSVQNRSAPPGPVVPSLIYDDVAKAIEWLCGAFGFTERLRTRPEPDGTIHHAQLTAGEGAVILSGRPLSERLAPLSNEWIGAVMVRVDDVDAHFERARSFGARILKAPATHAFGERHYSVEDLDGRKWAFTQSVADVKPEDWGAVGVDG